MDSCVLTELNNESIDNSTLHDYELLQTPKLSTDNKHMIFMTEERVTKNPTNNYKENQNTVVNSNKNFVGNPGSVCLDGEVSDALSFKSTTTFDLNFDEGFDKWKKLLNEKSETDQD